MQIKKSRKKGRKSAVIIVSIIAVLLAGYFATAVFLDLPPFNDDSKSSIDSDSSEQFVNIQRTESEKQASKNLEENPEQKVQNNQNDTPDSPDSSNSGKQSVNVLLTNVGVFNGMVSASGMVTNVAEQGGGCSYVFTNGSQTLTKTSSTLTNPTSTTCQTVSFPVSELTIDGTWTVKLHYSSSASEGVSGTKEFVR